MLCDTLKDDENILTSFRFPEIPSYVLSRAILVKMSSINDVTALSGGGLGFLDDSLTVVLKSMTIWVGEVNCCSKLRDVIYRRPQSKK